MHFQVKWTVRLDCVICVLYIEFIEFYFGEGGVKFIWCGSDSISLHVKIVLLGFYFR